MNGVRANGVHLWGGLAVWLAMLAMASGCAGGPEAVEGGDVHPTPLEIELSVATEDNRRLAYRLDRDGRMYFAGGREVLRDEWRESAELTLEQRGELWSIIEAHDLLEADGAFFESPDDVRYDVNLRAGRQRHSFRAVDDGVPGMAELADTLGNFHAEFAGEEVYRAIDGAIRRSGGNVPKR